MEQTPGKSKKYKHLESIQKETGSGNSLLFSQEMIWKNHFHDLLKLIIVHCIYSFLGSIFLYLLCVVQIILYVKYLSLKMFKFAVIYNTICKKIKK